MHEMAQEGQDRPNMVQDVDISRKEFNLGDYPTKHFPASHHLAVSPTYVLNVLQHITSNSPATSKVQEVSRQRFPTATANSESYLRSCKGVLKPILPNPNRLGIRMDLRSQLKTLGDGDGTDKTLTR